jgi:hypothetical protein
MPGRPRIYTCSEGPSTMTKQNYESAEPGMHPLEQLAPYLKPEYWDGHMVGDGDAALIPTLRFFRGAIDGARVLRGRLNAHPHVFPLEKFGRGDTFDPDAYDPGTVVLFREEELFRRRGAPMVQTATALNDSLALRPVNIAPFQDPDEGIRIVKVHGVSYHSVAYWGVVASQGGNTNDLVKLPVPSAMKFPSGRVHLIPPVMARTDFRGEIGMTSHGVLANGTEILSRVNILDVTAYGRARKQHKFMEMLGRALSKGCK